MLKAAWYGFAFLVVVVGCTDLNTGTAAEKDGAVGGIRKADGGLGDDGPGGGGSGGGAGGGGTGGVTGGGAGDGTTAGVGGGEAGVGGSDSCTPQDLYADADGDGQGDAEVVMSACEGSPGYVTQAGDCDDDCAGCYVGAAEDCDGKDNDCDGERDEVSARICGSNVGTCKEGVQSCADGAWGGCDGGSLAGEEACDGELDENCDGSVDEACPCAAGTSQPCGTDLGACTAGTQRCVAGVWSACEGAVGPELETCNAADDDCDDAIDEKLEQACGTDVGECKSALQQCSDGVWGACSGEIATASELCDNLDNDCDGAIDDGLTRPCGMTGGECRQGTQTCRAGVWDTACAGAVNPATEVCDAAARNEDCDAETNEGCACSNGATEPCGDDDGVCEFGSHTCSGGQWSACTGGKGPATEVCDAARLDEDCDAMINEGCACTNNATRNCGTDVGACEFGTETCVNGQWSGTCAGGKGPASEICDQARIDEDCDAGANEGCACANGTSQTCGVTDTGPCSLGTQTCSSGQWGSCSGNRDPGTESCNGVDDDCDGTADDGNLCPSGLARRCVGGRCVQCINHDECGGAEVCNSEGRCETACGNGVVDTVRNETCDFNSGATDDAWFCNHTNCRRSAYRTRCSSDSQCGMGEVCSKQYMPNHCAYPCSGSTCAIPPPSAYTSACVMSACLLSCDTRDPADCPSGTVCGGIFGTSGICFPM